MAAFADKAVEENKKIISNNTNFNNSSYEAYVSGKAQRPHPESEVLALSRIIDRTSRKHMVA